MENFKSAQKQRNTIITPSSPHRPIFIMQLWRLSTHDQFCFICSPKPKCFVLGVWIHLKPCFLSWTCPGGDAGCCGLLLVYLPLHLVDQGLRTPRVSHSITLDGETWGVLVAGRTKGQLCPADHKLGHLWRLSSNSQLIFRRALIMPSTVLT